MNSSPKQTKSKTKSKRKPKVSKSVKNKNEMNLLDIKDTNNGIIDHICGTNETEDKNENKLKDKSKTKANHKSDNHLITEYYPTLSSTRKRLTSKALELQRERHIEYYLKNNCDPKDVLAVEEFDGKGKGVVAVKTIAKGSFICEYSGELVDCNDAKTKEVSYALLGVGCYMYYFNWNHKIWCIDATKPTIRLGRLINHSRKTPNCKTKLIESNGRPHLVFIALRDINKNEEILYDYGERDKNAIKEHPWLTST